MRIDDLWVTPTTTTFADARQPRPPDRRAELLAGRSTRSGGHADLIRKVTRLAAELGVTRS
jgi:hypothetical protein